MAYHSDNEMVRWFKHKVEDQRLQDMAVAYSETINPPYPIFAKEIAANGCRHYCVGSWDRFFKTTMFSKDRRSDDRTFYEMIMEGRPVCMFFDIEQVFALNPGVDFSQFKPRLEQLIREVFADYFPETNEVMQGTQIIWLNASDDAKISFHVIVRIPGYAVDSTFACGRLALVIIHRAMERGWTEFSCKTILAEQVVDRSVVDVSVYSRNRNYRMEGNTKYKKTRWFLSERRRILFKTKMRPALTFDYDKDSKEFYDGCCTHFYPEELANLKRLQITARDIELKDPETSAWAIDLGYVKNILWGDTDNGPPTDARVSSSSGPRRTKSESVPAELKPLANELMRNISMTHMTFSPDDGIIMIGTVTKQCEIANRSHSHNHIWYQLNFGRHRKFRGYRQGCHNLMCKTSKPNWKPLPEEFHATLDAFWATRKPADLPIGPIMSYLSQPACDEPALKRNKREVC